ncbi:MAG: alpha-amylase [Bacteroidales bacterium]|nr:alpha-amylase [Bacteroidales bacterium]
MKQLFFFTLIFCGSLLFISCDEPVKKTDTEKINDKALSWLDTAVIYEVNLRQFTEEGTLKAFTDQHLERLHQLGVDILWLMPVHPIGELNRKGTLGSYYSIQDYYGVNPEYGTDEDFRLMVDKAHQLGMKVILDWVANHSAWDCAWVTEHPEYYTKDSTGKMISPFDWTDVVEFDYDNAAMKQAMIDALQYWITDFDIDGYRCDVAGEVPTAFWNDARDSLDKIKAVFMLAEAEKAELLNHAFHMDYGWEFHHIMNTIAKGEKTVADLQAYFAKEDSIYGLDKMKMRFITNHDENSWNGTIAERMGDAAKAFAVLSWTTPGMPLIYTGQESANTKRLEFFEKDAVDWNNYPMSAFYKQLNDLKTKNPALWNGNAGAEMKFLHTYNADVIAYKRGDVVVIINLSPREQKADLHQKGHFTDYFTAEHKHLEGSITLDSWGYWVLIQE